MKKLTFKALEKLPQFKKETPTWEDKEISSIYCCDLLSRAMGRAPSGCAWVTVMGNVNAIAVASLADVACIVLAEGSKLDEEARKKSVDQKIAVFSTPLPIYEAAVKIGELLNE